MAVRKRRSSEARRRPSKRSRALGMEIGAILATATHDLARHYDIGKELGRGQFGVIRQCTQKQTGESFACKSIAKDGLKSRQDVEDVRSEVEIMSHLSGHCNIVRLIDVFEDDECVHLVMELCVGGELFDRIVQRKSYPENDAALLVKSLVEVVKHCHDRGVIHRDLKPENILLATTSPASPIKLADFGLALRFVPGQKFSGMAGSAYYIAPEILNGNYSEEVDMWSVGVILYILLSGVPPFWGETEQGIFAAINEARIDFLCDPWWRISDAAKDLIRGLLCVDATTRLTPDQVLSHPWILRHSCQIAHCQGNGLMTPQRLQTSRRDGEEGQLIKEDALQDAVWSGHCHREPPQNVVSTLKDIWMPGVISSAHSFATIASSGYLAPTSPGYLQTGPCSLFNQEFGLVTEDLSSTFEVVVDKTVSFFPAPTHQNFDIHPVPPSTDHFAFVLSSLSSLSSLSTSASPTFFQSGQEPDLSPVPTAAKERLDNYSPPFSRHSLSQDDFDRWTSFSRVPESTFADYLVTMMEDGCARTMLKASEENDTVVVDSTNRKLLGVHDTEGRCIGWKVLDSQMPLLFQMQAGYAGLHAVPTPALPFSAEIS